MRERFGQDLDGHVASEFGVVRLIHFSHFPGTDLRDDFVRAEMGASRERHYLFPDGTRRFQLFKPVQHDIDLRGRLRLLVGLEHQKPLAIRGNVIVRK